MLTPAESPFQTITETLPGGLGTTSISYDYDSLYRLTDAAYTGAITATFAYEYDPVGNMTVFTETVDAQTTSVSRTFDGANRLQTSTDAAGTTSYIYDDNGNLTTVYPPGADAQNPVGALSYVYDQRNLMVNHETNPDGSAWVLQAEYVYDGESDRLQQVDYTGATPITTTYTNDIFGLTQVLVADDGTNEVYNLFGLDLISQDSGAEVRTLLVDGLGSVRLEMVGSVVETATTYSPYGEVLEQTGTSGTAYGFTGEQEDGATGLLYLRARYYNSELKAFQSRDRWAGSAFRPETFHPYSYVGGHVVNLSDPSGHCYPPLEGLRSIEPTNCNNLDMAIRIARHSAATFGQKSFAYGYITSWTGSHLSLVAGAGILGGHAAVGIVNWGGTYLATHQTAATLTTAAAATAGAADEAAVVYGAATGDPLAQQEAILAQQLAMADGHLPFADLGAGARFFGRRATSGLDSALRFLDDCFPSRFYYGGGGGRGSRLRPVGSDLPDWSLKARVDFLHSQRPRGFDQSNTTTAIVRTIDNRGNIIDIVANNYEVHPNQELVLEANEMVAPFNPARHITELPNGKSKPIHAEKIALDWIYNSLEARQLGLTPIEAAASWTICEDCAGALFSVGAIPVSPYNEP